MGKKGRFEGSDFREGGHRQGGVGSGQAQGRGWVGPGVGDGAAAGGMQMGGGSGLTGRESVDRLDYGTVNGPPNWCFDEQ